jgi:hypothetical protein
LSDDGESNFWFALRLLHSSRQSGLRAGHLQRRLCRSIPMEPGLPWPVTPNEVYSRGDWSLMLVACFEQDCDRKCDDCAEANPPWKFHKWQPAWLRVQLTAQQAGDVVWETTQNGNDDEACDHRDDVSQVIAASPGEHPT